MNKRFTHRSRLVAILIAFLALLMPIGFVSADNSPLCFTARNGRVGVLFNVQDDTPEVEYSTDGINWTVWTFETGVTIEVDQKIYFRATSSHVYAQPFGAYDYNHSATFYFASPNGGVVEASGNIMSLYGPDCPQIALQEFAFAHMFKDCDILTTPPSLPSTSIADKCYYRMFEGCTSLTTLPTLPATNLKKYCYYGMFQDCSSLIINVASPGIPWQIPSGATANNYWNSSMFAGTGGTFTGNPEIGVTYYIADETPTVIEDVDKTEYEVYSEECKIYVNGEMEDMVSVFDAHGHMIIETSCDEAKNGIAVSMAGVYFVRVGEKKIIKIIVK